MIEAKNLTKVYSRGQVKAIDSVSFDVQNGEIVGFVGLNGAGKTTSIRVASGVSLPTSGTVLLDGHDISSDKVAASKTVGWVPEFPNFEQNTRAKDLILYFAGFYGLDRESAGKRAQELFNALSLGGFEKKKLRTYSQGMKKRFSLAASMLPDPQNYLFDEILNGLDPEGVQFMRNLMVELKKRNKAVLLSSHILSEIENISDRVVFIHKGKIIKIATRDELSGVSTSAGGILKIVASNMTDSGMTYLHSQGEVRVEGNVTILSNFHGDSSSVNAELVRMGIAVHELSFEKASLEDYFFKLIGDKK
ncbi:MAG TPA: ABC transporter ATP-binding protein [Nitrososphaerales archaeon]|nr:ABC transporter ATP-binding protein [Nitrososphaerales archaeon]